MMKPTQTLCVLVACAALISCSDDSSGAQSSSGGDAGASDAVSVATLTYHGAAKSVIDARCATCHQPGDIGPFPLTTYDEVSAFAGAVRASIVSGTMPPWQPSDDCNTYTNDIDLSADEEALLLAWLDAGAPEGDPADAPADVGGTEQPAFEPTYRLTLPEPYTPIREPDDYRCQLIPWPGETTEFVTGLRVIPDKREIVHHVIAFLIGPEQVEEFIAYDEAEEGPGYTCYGGPTASSGGASDLDSVDFAALTAVLDRIGATLADVQNGNLTQEQAEAIAEAMGAGRSLVGTLGAWVPGTPNPPNPAGTGIRVEPGSMIVAQFHYNTISSAPVADQSVIEIMVADSVEREAVNLIATDLGWVTGGLLGDEMTIPAGETGVSHATTIAFDSFFVRNARQTLGLPDDAPLELHTANHHMHQLGRQQRTEIRHADGSMSCLLDTPDWDFNWQGSYPLTEPVLMREGDALWIGCTWDNTAADQPIVDGEVREPMDVQWGEGTEDEMCLAAFYVTAAE